VLASGLLLGSSTGLLLGLAHRDATEAFFAAEGAIHAWIAERGDSLASMEGEEWTPAGGSHPLRIRVERLARLPSTGLESSTFFSIHAAPTVGRGGREVSALVRVREAALPTFAADPDAAIVAGRGGRIVGTHPDDLRVLDGRDHPRCTDENGQASSAVVVGDGAGLQLLGGARLVGDLEHSTLDRRALAGAALGGFWIRDLAWAADIRFGEHFGEPAFTEGAAVTSGQPELRYDWGCPADLVDAIRQAAPGAPAPPPCAAGHDPSRHAVVAIDAANGVVVVGEGHGRGVLIVINGGLHLTGSFVFEGLIVVEGPVTLSGGRTGWPPSVEGAIVTLSSVEINGALTPPGYGGGGIRAVRFNRCALDDAVAWLNARQGGEWGGAGVLGRPRGWFEVVR
jgi:hypothetical protein